MTVSGVLAAMGTRELRTTLRAVVERVEQGTPVVVLKDGQPLAVMLQHEEAERWRRIEDSLAVLHAINVYPEALNDPSELADLASLPAPDYATIRRLTSNRARSCRPCGPSASPMRGPPLRPWSRRSHRAEFGRSSRGATSRSRSSRPPNTTGFAPSRAS